MPRLKTDPRDLLYLLILCLVFVWLFLVCVVGAIA
jgi:hypothetical protein